MHDLFDNKFIHKVRVKEALDKYIRTDMQGSPLPECKVLWKIKKDLGME